MNKSITPDFRTPYLAAYYGAEAAIKSQFGPGKNAFDVRNSAYNEATWKAFHAKIDADNLMHATLERMRAAGQSLNDGFQPEVVRLVCFNGGPRL